MSEYKRYFRSEEAIGLSMMHLAAVSLYGAMERLTGDKAHKGQGRLEQMGAQEQAEVILEQIRGLESELLDSEPDPDHRTGLVRKINTYQTGAQTSAAKAPGLSCPYP